MAAGGAGIGRRRAGGDGAVTTRPRRRSAVRPATATVDGVEDPAVAGAAAEVAGDRLAHLEQRRVGVRVEQVVDRHRPGPACRTRTAPRRRRRTPAARRSARRRRSAEALDGGDLAALGRRRPAPGTSTPARRRRSTEHEPHSPCSQAFLAPGSPRRSRSTYSRLSPSQASTTSWAAAVDAAAVAVRSVARATSPSAAVIGRPPQQARRAQHPDGVAAVGGGGAVVVDGSGRAGDRPPNVGGHVGVGHPQRRRPVDAAASEASASGARSDRRADRAERACAPSGRRGRPPGPALATEITMALRVPTLR